MSRFTNARPRASAAFYKAHGLGNDYVVFEEGEGWTVDAGAVARVCHPHEGVGSDGIVVALAPVEEPFRLRMFNPDGSEFERSGNGLRVLASWLHRTGRVETGRDFEVEVGGDRIVMRVHGRDGDTHDVSVEMGRARTGPAAVALDESLLTGGQGASGAHGVLELEGEGPIPAHFIGVGNPHCVVFTDALSAPGLPEFPPTRALLDRLGPALTSHPAFAHGTNVQVAQVPGVPATVPGDPGDGDAAGVCDALIWERGVGHTTASGTSACAVAVAAVESGRLPAGTVEVRMEGGSLFVDVTAGLGVTLRGPVREVMTGELTEAFVGSL